MQRRVVHVIFVIIGDVVKNLIDGEIIQMARHTDRQTDTHKALWCHKFSRLQERELARK
jgi:hypothetical protein